MTMQLGWKKDSGQRLLCAGVKEGWYIAVRGTKQGMLEKRLDSMVAFLRVVSRPVNVAEYELS